MMTDVSRRSERCDEFAVVRIEGSTAQVWAVLGDFGNIARWAPNVDHSCLTTKQGEGVDCVRRVQVGRAALLERVIDWQERERLAYAIEGLPSVVRSVVNTWALEAQGDSTMVTLATQISTGPRPPQQLVARVEACDRFLDDDDLRASVTDSAAIGDLDIADYDIVYLAGGWGAAFDLGFSEELGRQITLANERGSVIGGVCHGPLGLILATAVDGSPLVEGRRVSAVTDKQVKELDIGQTPHHPETELRKLGAKFESETRFRDPLANHWVVDGNLVTGQNQNAAPMVAREMMTLLAREGVVAKEGQLT